MGNPYHRIFVLDEEISDATTNQELVRIRDYVVGNHKFSLTTKKLLTHLITIKGNELSGSVKSLSDASPCKKSSEKLFLQDLLFSIYSFCALVQTLELA